MVREQAFTMLNRLAALRMMEARGLADRVRGAKAISRRPSSSTSASPGRRLGETGDAYRVFLLSVFDIYRADLPALFDRHSPQGPTVPARASPAAAAELINAAEIEPLWAEDETIGWIYQYFNTQGRAQSDARGVARRRATAASSPCATSSSPRATWWSSWSTTRSGGSGSTGRAGRPACATAASICW